MSVAIALRICTSDTSLGLRHDSPAKTFLSVRASTETCSLEKAAGWFRLKVRGAISQTHSSASTSGMKWRTGLLTPHPGQPQPHSRLQYSSSSFVIVADSRRKSARSSSLSSTTCISPLGRTVLSRNRTSGLAQRQQWVSQLNSSFSNLSRSQLARN